MTGIGDWIRYARAHRIPATIAALAVLTTATAAWGATAVQLPAGNTRGVTDIPLWVLLPVTYAAVAAASMHSTMSLQEMTASRPHGITEITHAVGATAIAIGFLVLGLAIADGGAFAAGAARNVILATGLGLIGGRIIGRPLAWIFPLAAIFPVAWFGTDVANAPYQWAIPLQPASNAQSWIISTAVYLIGVGATFTTHWHLRRLKRIRIAQTASHQRPGRAPVPVVRSELVTEDEQLPGRR